MQTQLPNKLTTLRKHFHYSQQEVANLCDIDLMVYMSWENGSKLPEIEHILNLAKIFSITADELIVNEKEVTLKEIPQQFDAEQTIIMKVPVQPAVASSEETQVVSKKEILTARKFEEKVEVEPKVSIKENVEVQAVPFWKKLNTKQWTIVGAIGVVVLLIIGSSLLSSNEEEVDPEPTAPPVTLNVYEHQQIVVASEYTLYINDDQGVTGVGNNSLSNFDVSEWQSIVALAAGDHHVVGLMQDGSLVASGLNQYGQLNVEEWNNIVSVSAGSNHTVGLGQDGVAICVGDNNEGQCGVQQWTNIKMISASGNATIAQLDDNSFVVAGDTSFNLDELKNKQYIQDFAFSKDYFIALYEDGTVACVSDMPCDVVAWTQIESVEANYENVVGLAKNGTVIALGDDTYNQLRTGDWHSQVDVAIGENFIVAINNKKELIGAGDATDKPFVEELVEVTLPMVGDVYVATNDSTTTISWPMVEGADFYEVSIEGVDEFTVNGTSLPVSNDFFVDGQVYKINVVASSTEEGVTSSQVFIKEFVYFKPIEETTSVSAVVSESPTTSSTSSETVTTTTTTTTVSETQEATSTASGQPSEGVNQDNG